jgi:hypothetical protein
MVAARSRRISFTSSLSAATPTPCEAVFGPIRAFMYFCAESAGGRTARGPVTP